MRPVCDQCDCDKVVVCQFRPSGSLCNVDQIQCSDKITLAGQMLVERGWEQKAAAAVIPDPYEVSKS